MQTAARLCRKTELFIVRKPLSCFVLGPDGAIHPRGRVGAG
jgi:hypothetical protein